MKTSMLLLSSFTAINGLSLITCQTLKSENEKNTSLVLVESDKLPGSDKLTRDDEQIFRHQMNKRIDANSQSLAAVRSRIKKKKKGSSDFSTTIFELELANGYMKIKLEDYKPGEVDKWKIFKRNFSKEMNEWNIEFADFVSTI